MSTIINRIQVLAAQDGSSIAVRDLRETISYESLWQKITGHANQLREAGCRTVGILADNSTDWVIADLAAMYAGVTGIPIPPYFSDAQLLHLVQEGNVDALILNTGRAKRHLREFAQNSAKPFGRTLSIVSRVTSEFRRIVDNSAVSKITFTSGSTGTPKGVCLSIDAVDQVSTRLADTFSHLDIKHHLCVSPLAVLLENIAGVYVPLMLGATVHVPSVRETGVAGSSHLDANALTHAIANANAESLILQPEALRSLTKAYRNRRTARPHMKFVAVGGARVSQADINEAQSVGIPAFQGYGLSECCSVVSLNRPNAAKPGSVGRPLNGVTVEIDNDGEILVSNQCMRRYLGDDQAHSGPIRTGDIGYIDDDGFLFVTGRKKDIFITSFGRNVSPEWPEAELTHQPEIRQACVFGEAQPRNTAVVVRSNSSITEANLAKAILRANSGLPDYARVSNWITRDEPFSVANGMLTPTGKMMRGTIEQACIE